MIVFHLPKYKDTILTGDEKQTILIILSAYLLYTIQSSTHTSWESTK